MGAHDFYPAWGLARPHAAGHAIPYLLRRHALVLVAAGVEVAIGLIDGKADRLAVVVDLQRAVLVDGRIAVGLGLAAEELRCGLRTMKPSPLRWISIVSFCVCTLPQWPTNFSPSTLAQPATSIAVASAAAIHLRIVVSPV
jgi:hypothetical protein